MGCFAQTWDGGSGTGAYGTAGNWNPNVVPNNVLITFNGASANGQYSISLGATRIVTGIVFNSAAGVNPFTFNGNQFDIGTSGITNNDADTQVFNSDFSLTGNQIWNAASGDLNAAGDITFNARTLTFSGANDFSLSGSLFGSGGIVKQGAGTVTFNNPSGNYSGSITVQAGSMIGNVAGSWSLANTISVTGGTLQLSPGTDFQGFTGTVTINGGTLRLTPGDEITGIRTGGTFSFGTAGGTLDLGTRLATGVSLGNITINSLAGTPGIIKYGSLATAGAGWDETGRILNIANGNLAGTGALSFELSNGAMVRYNQGNYGGSLNFTGVSGGNAAAGSASTSVGRLALDSSGSYTVGGGITFDDAMQVTAIGGARVLNANITINSGETAFQGRSRSSGTPQDLTIGAAAGTPKTLTVKDGATATMDIRFRDDAGLADVGGVTLNANVILEAGGTLKFTQSYTSFGEDLDSITVNRDITGQGTSLKESTVLLNIGSGVGGVNFATGAGTAGADLIVNGSGTGGLRLQGTQARVDNLLTTQRMEDLTGTGGTLTIAYTDNGLRTFSTMPTAGTDVRLGFDKVGGATPEYRLGSSANDLANWGGLVVKGGTVRAMTDQSFVGGAASTSLDLAGGSLILYSGSQARTLTFEGGANLTAGTLDGGASAGTLAIGGNLVVGAATLANSPKITMNVAGSATISGSTLNGLGTLTKQGAGTVTALSGIASGTIDIQSGTFLLGGDNLLGSSLNFRMSGGTLGTAGFDDAVGTLTLVQDSVIDLGSGSSILQFANSSGQAWTGGEVLTIANWNGGSDQLFFGNAMSALTAGQVSQIKFLNPNGVSGIFTATILASGEIVPVPEPATIAFGALLLGSLGFHERSRLLRLFHWLRKFAAA